MIAIMVAVNIAELRARLSSYVRRLRAGEEIVIRAASEDSAEEMALAATGELRLPSEELNEKKFWAIGARHAVTRDIVGIAGAAVSQDREDRDAGFLGTIKRSKC